jgi:hypothetical protein
VALDLKSTSSRYSLQYSSMTVRSVRTHTHTTTLHYELAALGSIDAAVRFGGAAVRAAGESSFMDRR